MGKAHLTCQDVEMLMQDYLDGYLLPSQREDLDDHLSRCAACYNEILHIRKLEAKLEETIPVDIPSGFQEAIISCLPRKKVFPSFTGKIVRIAGTSLASALVILLVALVVYSPRRDAVDGQKVEIVFDAPAAHSVKAVGDFSNWNVNSHAMTKGRDGTWRLTLHLAPGIYQYNFFVDDQYWAENPGSQDLVSDGFGGHNAVLFIEG